MQLDHDIYSKNIDQINHRARCYGAAVGCESQQVLESQSCLIFLFWSQCLDALQHIFVQVQHEQLGQNLIWVVVWG
jgi:hypothetical protein